MYRERESILQQVEAKRREVANAKETAGTFRFKCNLFFVDATKKQLLMIEKLTLDASQQSLSAAKELASLLPHQSAGGIETLSTVEIARFRKLIIDIPSFISGCRKLYNERAKNQIQKISAANSFSEIPSSKEIVVNKAAALLAERMAALGVKSKISQAGSEKGENSHTSSNVHSLSRNQPLANELDASIILPITAIPLNPFKVTTSANVINSEISNPYPNQRAYRIIFCI